MFDDNGSFLLAVFEFFIFFTHVMCLVWIFGDVFRSHDLGGGGKTLWVLFVIILPLLGMLIYLIARGGGMTQRALDQQKEIQQHQLEYAKTRVAAKGGGAGDPTEQIATATSLLDSGAITQAEYDRLKARALA